MSENEPLTIPVQGPFAREIRLRALRERLEPEGFGLALVSLGWSAMESVAEAQREIADRLGQVREFSDED